MTTETSTSNQVWVDDYVTRTGVRVAGHWRKKTHGCGGPSEADSESPAVVVDKPPATMDTFGTQVGDRFERDGKTYETVRITPAGAGGRGRASGPVVHLKAVIDGQVQPPGQGNTYDVHVNSLSDPASAYVQVTAASQAKDKVAGGLAVLRSQRERAAGHTDQQMLNLRPVQGPLAHLPCRRRCRCRHQGSSRSQPSCGRTR